MDPRMKIGELAKETGFSAKTIRYYESRGLIAEPERTASGYRSYTQRHVERLEFIEKAKRLGFTLEEVRDVLVLSGQQRPCEHVIALIDEKLSKLDDVLKDLRAFRSQLARLRKESAEQLERLPTNARVCGIIEQGVHARGEAALAWLEFRRQGKRVGTKRTAGS